LQCGFTLEELMKANTRNEIKRKLFLFQYMEHLLFGFYFEDPCKHYIALAVVC